MAEWQSAMSSREFAEWLAFFRLQPYGEMREDFRFARLMALLANVNRDPDTSREFTHEDFMPKFEDPEPDEPDDDQRQAVAMKIDAYFSALAAMK